MISDDEFRALQEEYLESQVCYSESHENTELAKMILAGVDRIDTTNEHLRQRYDDNRHWYQQQFVRKGVNGILSIFLLTKHQFYDSAYRDVRTLLEIFLILNHMNENKIKTAIQFHRQEREIWQSDLDSNSPKWTWKEMHSEDALHKMLAKEKNRLRNRDADVGRLFDFFSNRNVHPTRVDGVYNDREYIRDEEDQLLDWQLDFTLGLIAQVLKLYSDTPGFGYAKSELLPIGHEIDESHNVQNFFKMSLEDFPE